MVDATCELGHQVTGIFFFIDGVVNASRKIRVETGIRDLPKQLQAVVSKGIRVAVCSACADYRGVAEEDLAPGVDFAGLMSFADILDGSDKLIVFSL